MILEEYKKVLIQAIQLYYPVSYEELSPIVDYSIHKRYQEYPCKLVNNYTSQSQDSTLLAMADYIMSKEPIVTSYGTMFKKHAEVPNPLATVVQQFLDTRSIHKKKMFEFPKGTEQFEHYNLLQSLDKIDVNGIYGTIGQYTSLVYNVNVATSITSNGRTAVSSMMICFESFLANSVKFGSLDEVLVFINHVVNERSERKYSDQEILDQPISRENCFAKIIDSCGYRWYPNENEMDVIWRVINNLTPEDINRVYYKNNLYEFCSNTYMKNMIHELLGTLDQPYINPLKCPEEIRPLIEKFSSILMEYVYYGYMIIDRIDRCENMIKNVCMISDTDSTIISLDAWFRFTNEITKHDNLKIKRYRPVSVFDVYEKDSFGDITNKEIMSPFEKMETEYDYDFENDKLIEMKHVINPFLIYPEDNVRYSLINIMAYVLNDVVNDYMVRLSKANHSYEPGRACKLYAKTEFVFRRVLMTPVKKNYASIQELQEGNVIPEDAQLDIKGIASMAKSSMAKSTRDALKKILLDDILNTPTISQFKIIKDIAILEKKIDDSIHAGSREFYKPVTIKSLAAYDTPLRIAGIKAAIVWNRLKPDSENLPAINLEERNAIDIAKVIIDEHSIESIKDDFPEVYENAKKLLADDVFNGYVDANGNITKKGSIKSKHPAINSIAIPLDVKVPDWVLALLDYKQIINDNISGFVYESVGIQRLGKRTVNYTNILQL